MDTRQPKDSAVLGPDSSSQLSQLEGAGRAKGNCPDRFIPHQSAHHHQDMFLSGDGGDPSDDPNQLRNFQTIFQEQIIEKHLQKSNQPFAIYQNRNLLRFGKKSISDPITSKPWLAGLELREALVGFKGHNRKIKKVPLKVLEAPALQDDFYLNLIDWSPQDHIAIGLASSAYLWNPRNSQSLQLCDLGSRNSTTSIGYSQKQPLLAVGTHTGVVQVWDIEKVCRIRSMGGHAQRVGTVAWGGSLLSTGSRDKSILQRDLRCAQPYVIRLTGHTEQVCGLKWSFDGQQLSSGGNDNRLMIWSNHSSQPQLTFNDHEAAVKAVAWSPHQHGLLASGGGTVDRTIKFRNTLTGQTLGSWDAGSQVCNLAFSRTVNELVSTHGYPQNEVSIWKCGSMKKVSSLKGHSCRVLYLAMSPDGSTAVTGAGDETIRFWEIFPASQGHCSEGQLEDCSPVLR